jgi:hypothetical protein
MINDYSDFDAQMTDILILSSGQGGDGISDWQRSELTTLFAKVNPELLPTWATDYYNDSVELSDVLEGELDLVTELLNCTMTTSVKFTPNID